MSVQYSYTSTPPMGCAACTEPQCLYKGALYLYLYLLPVEVDIIYRIHEEQTNLLSCNVTFSGPCIVIHVRENDQQDVHFISSACFEQVIFHHQEVIYICAAYSILPCI